MVKKDKMKIKRLWNEIAKNLNSFNKEISKLIGGKSVYGEIDIDHEFLINQWIAFDYSEELTEDETKEVIKLIEKSFGGLSHYNWSKRFKNERDCDGDLRWNTYHFIGYLKRYKRIK